MGKRAGDLNLQHRHNPNGNACQDEMKRAKENDGGTSDFVSPKARRGKDIPLHFTSFIALRAHSFFLSIILNTDNHCKHKHFLFPFLLLYHSKSVVPFSQPTPTTNRQTKDASHRHHQPERHGQRIWGGCNLRTFPEYQHDLRRRKDQQTMKQRKTEKRDQEEK